MQPGISLCMIVKNEESNLDVCLKSVEGVVDEIVIVDTGSTDSTLDIARRHNARIIEHEWRNDFSAARNVSLDSAGHEWILVLDADEELDPRTREVLRDFTAGCASDGVEVVVRSEMPETDILKYEDTGIVRLFRNRGEYRYSMPVHEQIRGVIEEAGGKIEKSGLMINHHGYSRKLVQGSDSRAARNLKILNSAIANAPDNPYLHYQAGVTLMSMGRKDEAYGELKKVLELRYQDMGSPVLERLFMKISQLALDRGENNESIGYARRCLEYNPANGIAMYVVAIGLLSMNRVADGYQMLVRIRDGGGSSLRLGVQLEHLIKACRELLKI